MITTDAWILRAGPPNPPPGCLERGPYSFDRISDHEVLAEPLYGCWEGNMTHALSRSPIDVCRQRGEDSVVLGNAGVVRIAQAGSAVDHVRVGDVCVLISVDIWDEFGYPVKILAYDAPGTMGVLAKQMKLHAGQVYPLASDSKRTLQQWAAFSIRYATAWDNWKVAYGAWRLQIDDEKAGPPHVWAWGGGVSLAELRLAQSQGCQTALIASDDRRLALCRQLGVTPVDRRQFPDLWFDAEKFATDLSYRKRYMRSEAVFLDLVREHTGGAGVAIFIENIGAPVFRATRKALARQGVITTCGWKESPTLEVNRASECISRHIHVHTHGARNTHEALHHAEQHDWMVAADDDVCAWEDIPDLARDYADGKVSNYFPIFQVNALS